MTNLRDVTRLELIQTSGCVDCRDAGKVHVTGQPQAFECPACRGMGTMGREVVFFDPDKELEFSLQDDGRTLKIFIKERATNV